MNKAISHHEAFIWAQKNNLSLIVDFHNEVKRNFQNEIVKIDRKLEAAESLSDQERIKLEARKSAYINTFEPYLRINTFLMMVSHLEEWLYHLWKRHAPTTDLLEAKGSIGRFKPVLKEIGVDLSRSESWMFVRGCQDIRSCLLHANGRLSLNRNPERIRNFVAQYSDMIRVESDRLVLEERFLTCFQDAVEQLIASVKEA
ncbi:MAG TPA: hypothetical protein VIS57_05550 [Xanthomonadales bacterium]